MATIRDAPEAEQDAVRDAISNALSLARVVEDGEQAWPSTWVVMVAWTADDGSTVLSRVCSSERLPGYQIDGLLMNGISTAWNQAGDD